MSDSEVQGKGSVSWSSLCLLTVPPMKAIRRHRN